MSMGAFAMILLENALLPDEALVSDELKLVLALVAGAALWFVTTQAEHLIVQIFGAAAGMAAGSLVYNVAAHLAFAAVVKSLAQLLAPAARSFSAPGAVFSGRPRLRDHELLQLYLQNHVERSNAAEALRPDRRLDARVDEKV